MLFRSIVTGSRIPQTNLVTTSPVTQVTGEDTMLELGEKVLGNTAAATAALLALRRAVAADVALVAALVALLRGTRLRAVTAHVALLAAVEARLRAPASAAAGAA